MFAGRALDELARHGARRMIAAALKVEADDYVARFAEDRDRRRASAAQRVFAATTRDDGNRHVRAEGAARERRARRRRQTTAVL